MTGAEFGEVDIDLLADYIGGALTGTPAETAVAGRIADDPAWAQAHASLSAGMASVVTELGRLAPEPMPADVIARLDAPLITPPEPAPHLTLVHGDLAGADAADSVPEMATRRGRRLRWAAPIAVAAGLVAFVGFGLDYLAGRSTGSSTDTSARSGAGSARKDAAAPSLHGKVALPQLLTSGGDYTHATLGIAPVTPMLTPFTPHASGSARGLAAGGESALQRLTAPAALADCLAAIERANADGAIAVESVDYARFDSQPAVIVRFSAANGHWAWASGAGCGTPESGAATLDRVPVG